MGNYENLKKDTDFCFYKKFGEELKQEKDNLENKEMETSSQEKEIVGEEKSENKLTWPSFKLLNRRIGKLLKVLDQQNKQVIKIILYHIVLYCIILYIV